MAGAKRDPERAVCFHGWEKCAFCRVDSSRPPRKAEQQRCASCGRHRPRKARRGSAGRCWTCTVRGFVPLRLF